MLILLPTPAIPSPPQKNVTYEIGTVQKQSSASQKNTLNEIINTTCGYDAELLNIKVADINSSNKLTNHMQQSLQFIT
jgi:hypothetical protein